MVPGNKRFKGKIMGSYINPVNQSKEDWLRSNAKPAETVPQSINEVPEHLPVCLVDNRMFTAAGIAFDDRELEAFTYPDGRHKTWYWASKEKLLDPNVSDLAYYLKD